MLIAPSRVHSAITFTPLGVFGGVGSAASDVSADGSVVVGIFTQTDLTRAVFRWTSGTTAVRSTGLLNPAFTSAAVSADGSTVVGTYFSPNGPEAFRWTGDGPLQGLGDLAGGVFQSQAFDVSTDGRVIVGTGVSAARTSPVRWTADDGMVPIDDNSTITVARGVSSDGTVLVGSSPAFRWTEESGTVLLPRIRDADFLGSGANAVSADGSVVVGYNSFGRLTVGVDEAFRWTEATGSLSLQSLPWTFSVANDISGDGLVIVGRGVKSTNAAFYWTAETSMLDLQDLLISLGARNLDGWRNLSAEAISQDGLTIVGVGTDPSGATQAWVATIPEPSTIVFVACALLLLYAIYIRQRLGHRRAAMVGARISRAGHALRA